jgi:hypothetical protein
MLVQLLGKHGMAGRLVPYDDVSREKIETLDTTGLTMACISYLDIRGNPAHLRYLIQRLHRQLPAGTPILVGIWPSEDLTLREPSVRSQIGADCFTTSLGEAVSWCVEIASKTSRSVPPQAEI